MLLSSIYLVLVLCIEIFHLFFPTNVKNTTETPIRKANRVRPKYRQSRSRSKKKRKHSHNYTKRLKSTRRKRI